MSAMIVGGVLFGTILGRFFKVYILLPASILAAVLVLASPTSADNSWWVSVLEIAILITCLQVGYFAGLLTGSTSLLESSDRTWDGSAATSVSRSYHIQ
jgi:CDP-diglyceride synthetase